MADTGKTIERTVWLTINGQLIKPVPARDLIPDAQGWVRSPTFMVPDTDACIVELSHLCEMG